MNSVKFLLVSDTHGMTRNIVDKMIDLDYKDIDAIIHLGDYVEDGYKLRKILGKDLYLVAGNGDFQSGCRDEEIMEVNACKILLTHGHNYGVKRDLNNLYYRALELEVDLVLYGHTHLSLELEKDGILFVNPGSPSLPRDIDRTKTAMILEIDANGEIEIETLYLE